MTEKKETYNGWTNYETWNVALWMDNEQGSYDDARRLAREVLADSEPKYGMTREEIAAGDLAEILRQEFQEGQPDLGASVWADLLGAAMSDVNWREIAANLIEEVAREDAAAK